MWEEFTEPATVIISEALTKTWDRKCIKRTDGYTVMRISLGPDKQEIYNCRGPFGEFRFFAYRWNIEKNEPIDTYVVYLKMHEADWPLDASKNEEMIRTYSKDIESALINFPLHTAFKSQPARKVMFDVSTPPASSHLISAEEV